MSDSKALLNEILDQVTTILASSNNRVRLVTQAPASAGGGVGRWDAELVGIHRSTSHPEVILRRMRPAGDPAELAQHGDQYLMFDRIIDITTI